MIRFLGLVLASFLGLGCGLPRAAADDAKAAAPQTDAATVLMDALKTAAGNQLYQAYTNIGVLAELRPWGFYEASVQAQRLSSIVGSVEEVDAQLAKVAGLKELSKEDAAAIARLRKIAGHLQTCGKELQAYWDTGVADREKNAATAQKAAWTQLDDLLGLDPKKGIAPEPRAPKKR